MDTVVEVCAGCGQQLRVPVLRGALRLTCPRCRAQWDWAPPAVLTHFEADPARLKPLLACMRTSQDFIRRAGPGAEWPQNILSRKTVVYGSGAIGRAGEAVRHAVAPDELARCRRLADEACDLVRGKVLYGLSSEASLTFDPFSIAANADEPAPGRIDEALIQARFGGTIYPPATIQIEPIAEGTGWWTQVTEGAEEIAQVDADLADEEDPAPYLAAFLSVWRGLVQWFGGQAEFVDTAYVAIGDYDHLIRLQQVGGLLPAGAVGRISVYPRLFLGLTRAGSLAGVFTHVVLT